MVSLPDASRLLREPASAWEGFAGRLRAIGLDAAYVAGAMRVGERLDDALRTPMRAWLARRRRDEAAVAMRVLVMGDSAPRSEVAGALGDVGRLFEAGLLVETAEGVVSPFRLAFAGDTLVLSDDLRHGGDAVMGPSTTTLQLAQAARSSRVGSVLDVGTGAGTLALVLAHRAARVVATDTSARALLFAEVNARLNGAKNIELRQGDLFEPVRGETFDRVVSQPPFVARVPGEDTAVFLAGGARGDELALRLFSQIGDAMSAEGRALVLVDWPLVSGDAIDARVRRAIPEVDLNLLLLQSPARNLEDYCTLHAVGRHPTLGVEFAHAAVAMRDHLEAMGITGLALTLHVLTRAAAPPGWTSIVSTHHFIDAPPTPAAIDRALSARALLAKGERSLRAAVLRIPATRTEMPRGDLEQVVVHLPNDRLVPPVVLPSRTWEVARTVNAAPSVGAALAGEKDALSFLRDVERALLAGVLEMSAL